MAGHADSGDLGKDLTDLLVAAGEAAVEQGGGVLLAIDEIQYLTTKELAGLISAIHRTTQLDLPVVLVGAGLPQLPKLTGEAKSYAERLFEFPMVGPLDPDDAAAAITIPAEAHDVTYLSEFGEQNFAGKAGLAVAVEYALAVGLDPIAARIADLAGALRQQLGSIPHVEVRDEGRAKSVSG